MFKSIITSIVLAILAAVILSPKDVSATSIYDNYYNETPRLTIQSNSSCSKDITTDWPQYLGSYTTSFQNAVNSNGTWGVSQLPRYSVDANGNVQEKAVIVYWSQSPRLDITWNSWGYMIANPATSVIIGLSCNGYTGAHIPYTNYYGTAYVSSNDGSVENFFYNGDVTYPPGYEGKQIHTTSEWADLDGDGLIKSQEDTQGTSNSQKDTDGDGLNDLVESQWYSLRDDVFCGTSCAYPDPIAKDLYVEIDWMKNSSNRTFKPSSNQIGFVGSMLDDNDINLHVDTGQFGGGNELSTYAQTLPRTTTTGQIDFLDYKNGNSNESISANFSEDRNLIWRYMIYGYNYAESTGSSGWSETMGDDLFISGGLIEDMSGLVNTDRAIANTIAHELGHTVCLSAERIYIEQPNECMFFGIDNDDDIALLEDYFSVMNYRYQLTDIDDMGVVDYSDGSNGSNDHDDWAGVQLGVGGFAGTRTLYGASIKNKYDISPDGSAIIEEAPVQEVRENYRQDSAGSFSNLKNDPHLPQTASVSSKDDSREHKAQPQEKEQPSILDPLLVGGGAAILLSLTLGGIWAIRRLKY